MNNDIVLIVKKLFKCSCNRTYLLGNKRSSEQKLQKSVTLGIENIKLYGGSDGRVATSYYQHCDECL